MFTSCIGLPPLISHFLVELLYEPLRSLIHGPVLFITVFRELTREFSLDSIVIVQKLVPKSSAGRQHLKLIMKHATVRDRLRAITAAKQRQQAAPLLRRGVGGRELVLRDEGVVVVPEEVEPFGPLEEQQLPGDGPPDLGHAGTEAEGDEVQRLPDDGAPLSHHGCASSFLHRGLNGGRARAERVGYRAGKAMLSRSVERRRQHKIGNPQAEAVGLQQVRRRGSEAAIPLLFFHGHHFLRGGGGDGIQVRVPLLQMMKQRHHHIVASAVSGQRPVCCTTLGIRSSLLVRRRCLLYTCRIASRPAVFSHSVAGYGGDDSDARVYHAEVQVAAGSSSFKRSSINKGPTSAMAIDSTGTEESPGLDLKLSLAPCMHEVHMLTSGTPLHSIRSPLSSATRR
ncbi:hypothetical protein GW17_00047033, partial [Ensete ventricosum]